MTVTPQARMDNDTAFAAPVLDARPGHGSGISIEC